MFAFHGRFLQHALHSRRNFSRSFFHRKKIRKKINFCLRLPSDTRFLDGFLRRVKTYTSKVVRKAKGKKLEAGRCERR